MGEERGQAGLEGVWRSGCCGAMGSSSRVVLGVTLWSDQTAYFEGRGSAARIRAGALDPLGAHTLVAHSVELSPAARESWGVLTGRPALHPGAWSLVLPVGCSDRKSTRLNSSH